ncbi:MAG: substrate-binding domain-containing protein [Bryobacteraceae bacterium]
MRHAPGVILLIPSAREFDRGLRRGIVKYAQAHGPWVFYEEPPAYLQSLGPRQRLRKMRAWKAQGIILLQNTLREVDELSIPTVVAIGTRKLGKGANQLLCANEEIGRVGGETFLALGLRNFAYCGLAGLEFSDNRALGFTQVIQQGGTSVHSYSSTTPHLAESWYAEQKQLARWLSLLPKPIGVMACNDDRARMLAEACRLRGIRVPDEVAILGVDNDEQVCNGANPPLSSIALATERGGYEAAALLDTLMQGRKPQSCTLFVNPTHVVARQSTDTLAIDEPTVVRALRFIRDNANKDIRVADLLAASGVSRRALQDRFRECLGRTPIEEIHRCRVEHLARLLVETNMTVSEIAAMSGFELDAHVARFFSRHTGVTPLAYRTRNRALR